MRSRLLAVAATAVAVLIAGVAFAHTAPVRVGLRSHLFLVHRDGGALRLTGGRDENRAPVWCRSGRRIVALDSRVEVRAARDGRLLYRLSWGAGFPDWVAPSPDCKRVAVVTHVNGRGRIVLVDLNGRRRVLVRDGLLRCGGRQHPCPVWAPDGRTLYYGCDYDVCSVRTEPGSLPRVLIHDVYDGPQISPQGDWLAFLRNREDPNVSGLWIARADGSDERHLLGGPSVASIVFGWVPGGNDVFAHGGEAGRRILVISRSGSRHRIGRRFHGGLVALSPDRRRIAWTHQRYGRDIRVESSRFDGSGFRVLARFESKGGLTEIDTLAWSRDGTELLVEPHRHIGD